MRMNLVIVSTSALAVTTLLGAGAAEAKRSKPMEAAVSTESAAARAMRVAMADDTGARRDSDLHAPSLETAVIVTEPATSERGPTETQARVVPAGPLSGAMEELVAKQMQRSGGALDRCVTDLRARDPQLRGEIELSVTVVQKKATVAMEGATRGDAVFATCVAESAKTLRVSLPDLQFPWKIAVSR